MTPVGRGAWTGTMLALLGAACSGSDGTVAPVRATGASYDVTLQLDFIFVAGACEDAPDDPGEFAYRIRLEAPAQSQRYATTAFPEEAGAVTYRAGDTYALGQDLYVYRVRETDRGEVLVRFSATEFDAGGPDARMSGEEVVVPLSYRGGRFERTISVRLGHDSECQLILSALPGWTLTDG